jgi:hypothetical protein
VVDLGLVIVQQLARPAANQPDLKPRAQL